jgi:SM-20-related protein
LLLTLLHTIHSGDTTSLFESITNDIIDKGYSIRPYALPENLAQLLLQHVTVMSDENFKRE